MNFRNIYLIILLGISLNVFGQEKQLVDNGYEKGTLVNGYKEGVWQYFDNDTLKIQIDYSTGRLTYLAKDTTKYAILTDNGWELSKLDVSPHYLGSNEEIQNLFYNNLRYPHKALAKNKTGTVLLGFEINLQGKVENAKIIKDIGYGSGDAVMEVFNQIPNYWLVAQKGKKQYRARYVMPIHFSISKKDGKKVVNKKDSKKEIKMLEKAKKEYYPARYFPELSIVALGVVRSRTRIRSDQMDNRLKQFPNTRNKVYR
ncbi:MAG TPA: TonB family protein [Bacteroidetes bacterium]|nr:TonB family protein [Bacteroidota bacterium]